MQSSSFNAETIDGTRTTGQDVRSQNVTACLAIANVIKSSLGPTGLDKVLVSPVRVSAPPRLRTQH